MRPWLPALLALSVAAPGANRVRVVARGERAQGENGGEYETAADHDALLAGGRGLFSLSDVRRGSVSRKRPSADTAGPPLQEFPPIPAGTPDPYVPPN